MQTKAKFGIGAGIIVGTLACLAWVGIEETKTYYYSVSEMTRLEGRAAQHRMRVRGGVRTGSIARYPGRVDFVLEENGQSVPVSYVGREPLPDTFVDGADALVEGRRMPDGRFVAEKVQAKCASKYEAAPGEAQPGYGRPEKRAPSGSAGNKKS